MNSFGLKQNSHNLANDQSFTDADMCRKAPKRLSIFIVILQITMSFWNERGGLYIVYTVRVSWGPFH